MVDEAPSSSTLVRTAVRVMLKKMIPNTSLPRRRNMKRTAIRLRTRTRLWPTTLYMTFLVSRVMNGESLLVGTHRRGTAR